MKTNKESALPRKRAPGAGRKPKGHFKGKKATFTTRITTETRQALDSAAKKKGRSLSQEVERRLVDSLKRDASGEQHVRALGEAFMLMVQGVERASGHRWCDDAFTAEALPHGTGFLISHFGPDETPRVPKKIEEVAELRATIGEDYRNPSKLGLTEAGWVISLIERWSYEDLSEIGQYAESNKDIYVPSEWFVHSELLRDLGSGLKRRRSRK
jgi:hypothetical protein